MSTCPKSSHNVSTKSWIVKGRQRWKCKSRGYHYTVFSRGATKEQKRQALELYLEGLGFRSIGRILKFSHVAVHNWIKEFGEKLGELKSGARIKVVEIDEMHSCAGQKNITVGSGSLLIEIGGNSSIALLAGEIRKPEKSYGNRC